LIPHYKLLQITQKIDKQGSKENTRQEELYFTDVLMDTALWHSLALYFIHNYNQIPTNHTVMSLGHKGMLEFQAKKALVALVIKFILQTKTRITQNTCYLNM
jgi:hypothetical protein